MNNKKTVNSKQAANNKKAIALKALSLFHFRIYFEAVCFKGTVAKKFNTDKHASYAYAIALLKKRGLLRKDVK